MAPALEPVCLAIVLDEDAQRDFLRFSLSSSLEEDFSSSGLSPNALISFPETLCLQNISMPCPPLYSSPFRPFSWTGMI